MKMRNRHRKRVSFTIVELLVVISIVSLLAALLLPALTSARSRARQMVCLANMRQVHLALSMMAGDNDGWINGTQVGGYTPTPVYWFYSITNSYLTGRTAVKMVGADSNPAASGRVGCPDRLKGDASYSFGVNTQFTGGGGGGYSPAHSLSEVTHPSRIFLVADCYFRDPVVNEQFDWTVCQRPPWVVSGSWVVTGRHRGQGLNFVFVDGHGEFLQNRQWWNIPGASQWGAAYYTSRNLGIWSE
jgi:prepilin-type processing-associated H-X9-DG protein